MLIALESAVLAMRFITAPNMPTQIRIEEVIEAVINCTKFHLELNVYPLSNPMHFELKGHRRKRDACEAALLLGVCCCLCRKSWIRLLHFHVRLIF